MNNTKMGNCITAKQFQDFSKEEEKGNLFNVGILIKEILLEIKDILESENKYSNQIENLSKELLTKAFILDGIFSQNFITKCKSDYDESNYDDYLTEEEKEALYGFRITKKDNKNFCELDEISENIESDIYHRTPIIGVFFNGIPIFLNKNYLIALSGENLKILKEDIIKAEALKKYYTIESSIIAKKAVEKLKTGDGYKDLILETKDGKIISWNSFGNKNGLEVRIGNDITHGRHQNEQSDIDKNGCEGISFDTKKEIKTFITKVESLIQMPKECKNYLMMFGFLSTIIDKVWNDGQYLMNITGEGNKILFNSKYAKSLKMLKKDIFSLINKKTEPNEFNALWKETYDDETLHLIKILFEELKDSGYYVSNFNIKDNQGNENTYSWLRFLVKDDDFGINVTVGMGNNAVSKLDKEILDYLHKV